MPKGPFIGAHVSSAGSIDQAIDRITEIGGNAVQIFASNPRGWKGKAHEKVHLEKYLEKAKEKGVEKSVIHAIYLVNLASPNQALIANSMATLKADLMVAAAIKAEGVVVHLGSHLGRGFDAVKDQLVANISKILQESPEGGTFLIENSAGQQGKIASNLEEIRYLLDEVDSPRLGWCLDTCHASSAGYEIHTKLFDEIGNLGLWDSLKVVHVNDSRDPFSSGKDRHANLGEGTITNEMFTAFFANPKLRSLPFILEVPGVDKMGPNAQEIEKLRALVK
ncbi:MAG TPA: deoxyribonuclease IV [Patescibacteria group bacterium]|nr:deoxyribonuclease IV [Patescibacteria group bacterium]